MTKKRIAAKLNTLLDRKLFAYATAAGAAGVSILALVQPGRAEIVYTPVHHEVHPNSRLALDLDNDGVPDFQLTDFFSSCCFPTGSGGVRGSLRLEGVRRHNQALGYTTAEFGRVVVSALAKSAQVGASGKFLSNHSQIMRACDVGADSGASWGPWGYLVTDRFLGLVFVIDGQKHYGWAGFNVRQSGCKIYAALTGYAYETTANQTILAGQTSGTDEESASEPAGGTLGFLALGAAKK